MMDLVWLTLGVLTFASALLLRRLSRAYRLDWAAWTGFGLGISLLLLCVAWSVASILEGVPRAASMGIVCFGLPGVALVSLTMKYVDARLARVDVQTGEERAPEASLEFLEEESSWPHSDAPDPELLVGERRLVERFSRLGRRVRSSLRYLGWGSLALAFVVGKLHSRGDYETMVKVAFPDVPLTRVNDNPVVFQLGEKLDGVGNYVLIQEGQGYGGPFVIGVRIMDDGRVHQVLPLEHRETPAFARKVEAAGFGAQFTGKSVTDDFVVGRDVDAVSGATITTMAATQAVRSGAHIAATRYFEMEPTWESVPLGFGFWEVAVLLVFALAFVKPLHRTAPWRYVYIGLTVAVVGFALNASLSVGTFAAVAMGYVPTLSGHLVWWILVGGTLATIVLLGRNIYCFRICPFYWVQFLLARIGGVRMRLSDRMLKRSRFVSNLLLWASLMIIFLSSHPGLGSYEPFAMMFSLEGAGIQWFILPIALIGSFFTSAFWCRYLCPCGHALTQLVKLRRAAASTLRRPRPTPANE